MKLSIKNMVCPRCILVVQRELNDLNISCIRVGLGFVDFESQLPVEQLAAIEERLVPLGFEILKDKKIRQVEEIKNLLIQKIQTGTIEEHFSIREYISAHVGKEYSNMSRIFSQKEECTIEQYFILLKLEKVKELITYGEKTLNDISWILGYSSVQHLSSQFKRVLGISTREFKASIISNRLTIDKIGTEKKK